ncbi:MAG: tetratricopeptide repeat protein [Oscillospiraceae bacterium]|nr:tetratricopeptide repeat protein [Oscillospiraceae bacterium]
MSDSTNALRPEDYTEPACPLCMDPPGTERTVDPIPQQRVVQKLDDYMSRRDYAGAERHLLYWLSEAERGNDLRGELLVRNELIGHYRKVGKRGPAFEHAERALQLLDVLELAGGVSAGTTYVNAATACSAFGEHQRALELFERARAVYEADDRTQKHLLGGLYNNMGLCCVALGRCDEAFGLYEKAMDAMGAVAYGVLEQAITCLNMADAVSARDGLEAGEREIFALLDRAYDLLHTPDVPHNGYYAFVCEKCAPTFSYYGYFLAAQELEQEAKEIYERP